MRRRALQLLAISCLVALAGCSGALSGGESGQTLEDVTYPDGVSDDGTNVSALADAHDAALENRSFALELDSTVNASGTNQSVRMDAEVGAERDDVRLNASARGQQLSAYLTADRQYTRIETGSGAAYQASERSSGATNLVSSSFSGASYLDQFAGVANVTPTDVREEDGTTLVVLRADGSNATAVGSDATAGSDATVAGAANVTDYDATILVDEQGVVHSITVDATAASDGQQARTQFSMELSDVGETTVDEPGWLDEARNRTSG